MRFLSSVSLAFTCLTASLWSGLVNAAADPYDPSPVTLLGILDSPHCDDPTNLLSGGSLSVNGVSVVVPKNTLITLPSITIAWCELFKTGSSDTPNLPLWGSRSFEVSVLANKVGGTVIAGLIYIAPEFGQITGEGFINFIDYSTGVMRVGGTIGNGNTGQKIRINDPTGRYGIPFTDWPLMTADPDNPSIHASSAYPLCVPRSDPAVKDDPLCPAKNRPLSNGVPLTKFTFGTGPFTGNTPDPNLMAPLMLGDYVTYSGAWVAADMIAVYALEANLGFYTAPGTQPAYLSFDEAAFGIVGPAGEVAETRLLGFSTDPSTSVTLFALDVDPCTGAITERQLGAVVPRGNGVLGNWRFRTTAKAGFIDPATRQVVAKSANFDSTLTTKNGLVPGQFVQPIMQDGFIFPELLVLGDPMFTITFDRLPFLAQGSGPYQEGVPLKTAPSSPPIVGQLSPWPGSPAPNAPTCANPPPTTPPPTNPPPTTGTDTITLVSSSFRNQRGTGFLIVTVRDSITDGTPVLTMTTTNPNSGPTKMNFANGQYTLQVDVRPKPASVKITSSKGGTLTFVP